MWDETMFEDVTCEEYYGDAPTDDEMEMLFVAYVNDDFQDAVEATGKERTAAGWTDLEPGIAN